MARNPTKPQGGAKKNPTSAQADKAWNKVLNDIKKSNDEKYQVINGWIESNKAVWEKMDDTQKAYLIDFAATKEGFTELSTASQDFLDISQQISSELRNQSAEMTPMRDLADNIQSSWADYNRELSKGTKTGRANAAIIMGVVDRTKQWQANVESIGTDEFLTLNLSRDIVKAKAAGRWEQVKALELLQEEQKVLSRIHNQITETADLMKKPFTAIDTFIKGIPVIGELLASFIDFDQMGDDFIAGFKTSAGEAAAEMVTGKSKKERRDDQQRAEEEAAKTTAENTEGLAESTTAVDENTTAVDANTEVMREQNGSNVAEEAEQVAPTTPEEFTITGDVTMYLNGKIQKVGGEDMETEESNIAKKSEINAPKKLTTEEFDKGTTQQQTWWRNEGMAPTEETENTEENLFDSGMSEDMSKNIKRLTDQATTEGSIFTDISDFGARAKSFLEKLFGSGEEKPGGEPDEKGGEDRTTAATPKEENIEKQDIDEQRKDSPAQTKGPEEAEQVAQTKGPTDVAEEAEQVAPTEPVGEEDNWSKLAANQKKEEEAADAARARAEEADNIRAQFASEKTGDQEEELGFTQKLGKRFGDLSKKQKMMAVGALAVGAAIAGWAIETLKFTRELGYSMKELPKGAILFKNEVTALAEEFGTLRGISTELLFDMKMASFLYGVQQSDMAKILKLQTAITGESNEMGLDKQVKWMKEIRKEGLSASKIFTDMGQSMDFIAMSSREGGENIKNAAIYAGKMGLELKTVETISDSLLDYETSIANEMALQAITGKSINLERARQLAYLDDQEGFMKEIKNQLGAEFDWTQMTKVEREALGDAIGITGENLLKFVGAQDKSNESTSKGASTWGLWGAAALGVIGAIAGALMVTGIGAAMIAGMGWGAVIGTALGYGIFSSAEEAFAGEEAGDLFSPAKGKTQVSPKEGGLWSLSDNDDVAAGPGLIESWGPGKDWGSRYGENKLYDMATQNVQNPGVEKILAEIKDILAKQPTSTQSDDQARKQKRATESAFEQR